VFAAEDIRVHFGGVRAVDGVDLKVDEREIVGLIGPNGAGKTTLMNALTGFVRPNSGAVHMSGTDVTGWSPERLVQLGLARTFQDARLFSRMTVLENVILGAHVRRRRRRDAQAHARSVLEFMGLTAASDSLALAVPHGVERKVAVARAVASEPEFLFLDEPAAGLDEHESDDLMRILHEVRDRLGCAIMIIDHDMRVIMRLCERIQVLDSGQTIAVGKPDEISRDARVMTAYLGREESSDAADR
jgi:branched-chain amino acid transport system ATP-binding protein